MPPTRRARARPTPVAGVSRRKFQRAQNRDLAMPIFRGDEEAALDAIERKLGLERSAA